VDALRPTTSRSDAFKSLFVFFCFFFGLPRNPNKSACSPHLNTMMSYARTCWVSGHARESAVHGASTRASEHLVPDGVQRVRFTAPYAAARRRGEERKSRKQTPESRKSLRVGLLLLLLLLLWFWPRLALRTGQVCASERLPPESQRRRAAETRHPQPEGVGPEVTLSRLQDKTM